MVLSIYQLLDLSRIVSSVGRRGEAWTREPLPIVNLDRFCPHERSHFESSLGVDFLCVLDRSHGPTMLVYFVGSVLVLFSH